MVERALCDCAGNSKARPPGQIGRIWRCRASVRERSINCDLEVGGGGERPAMELLRDWGELSRRLCLSRTKIPI
eukprot:scaffold21161_cov96-Cyclotella_meneghiniana.AAC.4